MKQVSFKRMVLSGLLLGPLSILLGASGQYVSPGFHHHVGGGGKNISQACQVLSFASTDSCTLTLVAGDFARITMGNLNSQVATLTVTGATPVARTGDPFVQTSITGLQGQEWTVKNLAAGSTTFTYNFTGAQAFPIMDVIICSGCSTTAPIDVETANATDASIIVFGGSVSCGAVTTTVSGDLIIADFFGDSGGTWTAGTTPIVMTLLTAFNSGEQGVTGAPGSVAVQGSFNNTDAMLCNVMALK